MQWIWGGCTWNCPLKKQSTTFSIAGWFPYKTVSKRHLCAGGLFRNALGATPRRALRTKEAGLDIGKNLIATQLKGLKGFQGWGEVVEGALELGWPFKRKPNWRGREGNGLCKHFSIHWYIECGLSSGREIQPWVKQLSSAQDSTSRNSARKIAPEHERAFCSWTYSIHYIHPPVLPTNLI